MKLVLLSLAGFLLGSIPTGKIIAGSMGIDLQKAGSGNIGATNVLRTTGKLPALLTLIGDMAKGSVAVLLARYFEAGPLYMGVTGIMTVLGHNFSLFLNFKGGKGVATGLGVLIVFAPLAGLASIIIWLLTVLVTRTSSLGAIVSFCMLPLSIYLLDSKEKLPISFILSIIVLMRHKDNIGRLIRGTEPKVGRKA
ncbi:MAG TPA: glycerol-3-phosphate 1-O-acyltransferase PlsY [Thermodesulfovibrionales bacterium]|nr:glycerol-3-phosphate 1-O-acyltransferase PlsY [Thermodesulfovibrionales bacterium]